MKKRLLSLTLAAVMACSALSTTAFATDMEALHAQKAANAATELYELGLFSGTGTDANGNPIFELDRAPTRHEAVTMLVNMLGKGEEAKAGTWDIPFTDVADWAKPFVGYAYTHGLTSGTSATTFGGNEKVTAAQYITFALKVLGYEAGKDFQWDKAWKLSDAIFLTDKRYDEYYTKFTRGDVAVISLGVYNLQKKLEEASAWGVSPDIKWIAVPETPEDVDNNILYSFLFGNYSLYFKNVTTTDEIEHRPLALFMQSRIKMLSQNYPELVGVFSNTFVGCGATMHGTFIDFPQASLSIEEIYEQQNAVLEVARTVQAELYKSGAIADGMTQLEIAKVYYDYLCRLGVSAGGGPEAAKQGRSVEFDSPYACLVKKKADCVGRAGAFNLLMHLEGISAQGVAGKVKGTNSGHVISRVVLDGAEYFCDWGNKRGIALNIDDWFEFNADSLAAARAID